MTILLSLFGQAAIAPDKEKNFLMPEQPETASEGAIHEIVSQNESKASLPCAPETPQNPPCATLRTKDEPKATPEENGPENGDKAAVARWWRPWPMPGTVAHAGDRGTSRRLHPPGACPACLRRRHNAVCGHRRRSNDSEWAACPEDEGRAVS